MPRNVSGICVEGDNIKTVEFHTEKILAPDIVKEACDTILKASDKRNPHLRIEEPTQIEATFVSRNRVMAHVTWSYKEDWTLDLKLEDWG